MRGEFSIRVPDQELETFSMLVEVHQQVAALLGHPLPRRVSGDPGQVHTAGVVLDDEQHLQAAQEDRINNVDGANLYPRPVSSPWMRR